MLSSCRDVAIAALMFASIWLVGGCDLSPSTPAPVSAEGIVVGAEDGEPIAGAQVSVQGGGSTLTNPDGTYKITGLDRGVQVRLIARKEGYDTTQIRVETPRRDEKSTVNIDFTLAPDSLSGSVD